MRFILLLLPLTVILMAGCQSKQAEPQQPKITVDNEKVKVTEFTGAPNGDVCGVGVHSHGPHLTILLSDGKVEVTRNGKKEQQEVFKGLSFWSEAETHSVINVGNSVVQSMIVEVK
jgi:2-C-methyl-D-erythritol 4-phosphate cytidylyltransferase